MDTTDVVTEDRIDRQFEVGPDSELIVENVAGWVLVRAGDSGTFVLHAEKHGSDNARANTEIECVQEGNQVHLRTRKRHGSGVFSSLSASNMATVNYDLTVPADCRVEAKGVSSSVEIDGVQAPAVAETVSGAVAVRNIDADCTATTVSGRIDGTNLVGQLTVRTTSGRATVDNSRLSGCTLNSVSGSLSLETPLSPNGYYYARTVSGDLRLRVPGSANATIQLKSVSGTARVTGLSTQTVKSGTRNWQGRIGNGGATIEMNTVSGNLSVTADGENAEPDHDDSQTAGDGNTNDILRAVEQGDLSVDEALSRLKER